MGVVVLGFLLVNFIKGGWFGSDGFSMVVVFGMFVVILFVIWFFLVIEGVVMVVEEVKDFKCFIFIVYIIGIFMLVVLVIGVMFFVGGVGDWIKLVNINDLLL